jgi:SAM-dependent methyltransferase
MEHKSLTVALSDCIYQWLSHRPGTTSDFRISVADLGCGDLACFAPLYRSLPLKLLCGVDMSDPALELAAKNLQETPTDQEEYARFREFSSSADFANGVKTAWVNSDVLNWASFDMTKTSATKEPSSDAFDSNDRFDLIICAFVIHHLSDENKRKYLRGILQNRMNPGGIMLMADVFRCNGEDRNEWLSRFHDALFSWTALTEAQKAEFYHHISTSDYPATIEEFTHDIAPDCGWDAHVVWTNSNSIERLVVLRQSSELRSSGR